MIIPVSLVYSLQAQSFLPFKGTYDMPSFILQFEKETSYRFVYQSAMLDSTLQVSFDFSGASITDILDFWVAESGLTYTIKGKLIILSYLPGQKVTLSGYVTDAKTNEKLIGATIQLASQQTLGVTSNEYGYFAMTVPSGKYRLVISYVGYVTLADTINITQNLNGNFRLTSSSLLLNEVTVTARENKVENIQISTTKIDLPLIKKLPAIGGEIDILRSLQLLPGIQFGTEGTSGFNVRGGSQDQNLILLDGVPMYNVSHLFGFLSVFNSDAINNVDIIKGAFPARYGGRLSSVLDISIKEGNDQKIKGDIGLSILASKIFLDGPLIKDKASFMISARRSYLEPIFGPISKQQKIQSGATGGKSNYAFYDINAKLNFRLTEKDRLYLSYYSGRDNYDDITKRNNSSQGQQVDETKEIGLNWGNQVLSLRWNHVFQPTLFANFNLFSSRYALNTLSNDFVRVRGANGNVNIDSYFDQLSAIQDYGAKVDFSFFPNARHSIRFGGLTILHSLQQDSDSEVSITRNAEVEQFKTNLREGNQAWESYVFIEDEFQINEKLGLNFGIHISNFLSENTFYPAIQPRLSGRWAINGTNAVKIGYARSVQYLHLLSNSGVGLPTDIWISSSQNIRPQTVDQLSAGFVKNFGKCFDLTIEGFVKKMSDLVDFKDGASFFLNTQSINDKITTGDGQARGVEFMLQKQLGTTQGWLSYTLSKSDRRFDLINAGESFPFLFDRRHDFSILVNHKLTKNWNISTTWVYLTGRAITLPVSSFVENSVFPSPQTSLFNDLFEYSSRNAFRFKPYHRLDISANYEKTTKWGGHRFSISVYNLYNRQNTFFLSTEFSFDTSYRIIDNPLFPLIPGISYGIFF